MGNEALPAGWALVPLGDILLGIEAGKSFKCDERPPKADEVGVIKVSAVSWGEYREQESKTCKDVKRINETLFVQRGDFLFSRANTIDLVGACVIASEVKLRAMLSDKILRFKFFNESMKPLVLNYLRSAQGRSQIETLASGNQDSMRNIGQGRIEQILLPFAPAAEQTRIVEKLEELLSDLDAGVAELKAAQRKLAQYRQSLLKAAVEGALTADWRAARAGQLLPPLAGEGRGGGSPQRESSPQAARPSQPSPTSAGRSNAETGAELLQRILSERRARWEAKQLARFAEQGKTPPKDWQAKYPEPVAPDTADLTVLPHDWAWATLDQLAEFITSGSRGWADYYATEGATFIRSQNINKDSLDLSDIAYVNPPKNSEGARTRVQMSDLLLTITGANVGKAAWVDSELQEAYVSQHVALIRPVDAKLSSYLHLHLTAVAGGRGQLNKEAYGAGKPGLNLQQVATVLVPLPSNSELANLMEDVATQLDAATSQYRVIEHALKQATAQRKNILKAAFAGQLVPQDPSDEPASVLLTRIRAERDNLEHPSMRSRRAKQPKIPVEPDA